MSLVWLSRPPSPIWYPPQRISGGLTPTPVDRFGAEYLVAIFTDPAAREVGVNHSRHDPRQGDAQACRDRQVAATGKGGCCGDYRADPEQTATGSHLLCHREIPGQTAVWTMWGLFPENDKSRFWQVLASTE